MKEPQYGNYPDINPANSDNRLHNPPPYQPNHPGQPQQHPNVVFVQSLNQQGQPCPVCYQITNSYVTR